jgi:hypothetical protein
MISNPLKAGRSLDPLKRYAAAIGVLLACVTASPLALAQQPPTTVYSGLALSYAGNNTLHVSAGWLAAPGSPTGINVPSTTLITKGPGTTVQSGPSNSNCLQQCWSAGSAQLAHSTYYLYTNGIFVLSLTPPAGGAARRNLLSTACPTPIPAPWMGCSSGRS